MTDQEVTLDQSDATNGDQTAEVIPSKPVEAGSTRGVVIRHVIERQLTAGHGLSAQLVDAATEVSVAVAHAPATVVGEIRGGATLPAALSHGGGEVRGAVSNAGNRVRSAIGGYVGNQATLPSAVVVGAFDVAETALRAQGTVAASAVDAAFTVATAAARGDDVRDLIAGERREIGAKAAAVRVEVGDSVDRARQEIRAAVMEYDVAVEAFSDTD